MRQHDHPAIVVAAGERAAQQFVQFFTANIRNRNTRAVYDRAVGAFYAWCEERGLDFLQLNPVVIADHVEQLLADGMARLTVKQHLAAIRTLFGYVVMGGILPFNPAFSVRGLKHVIKKSKMPVLDGEKVRALLAFIDTGSLTGLRDRALIGVRIYTFARVGAVLHI